MISEEWSNEPKIFNSNVLHLLVLMFLTTLFPLLLVPGQSQTQVQSHALVPEHQAMIRSPSSPASVAVMKREPQLHNPHLQRPQATPPPTPQVIAGAPGR